MTLERLDGSNSVQPQRWWRRLLPYRTVKDHAPLWAWSSVALSLLALVVSLLGFNSTTIGFAAFLAASLVAISRPDCQACMIIRPLISPRPRGSARPAASAGT